MSCSRYFYFWCVRCPTRITVETEVPASEFPGEFGLFAPADAETEETRSGYASGDRCPACHGKLHNLDELVAQGLVSQTCTTSEAHAAWRKEMAADGS